MSDRARAVASLLLPHLTSLPRVHTLPQDKPVSFPGHSHHQYQVMGTRQEMAFIDCLVRMWVEYIASHVYGTVCRHGSWRAQDQNVRIPNPHSGSKLTVISFPTCIDCVMLISKWQWKFVKVSFLAIKCKHMKVYSFCWC